MIGGIKQKRTVSESPKDLQRRPNEATEDYLETIASLIEEKGFVASVDIAERMNVSKPTVTSIVKKLDRQGFLVHERYRGIRLTQKGKDLARQMRERHQLITRFLTLFDIDEVIARQDAERIEHGLHPDTVEMMGKFTDFALTNPDLLKNYRSQAKRKG